MINMRCAGLATLLLLGSCASSEVQFSQQLDPNEKTITMAPGSSLLLGPFKEALRSAGWRIAVDRGPVRTVGTLGANTDISTGQTFKTRYRLALNQRRVDTCLGTGLPMVSYDMSLIDNDSGEEIMTASGRDCVDLAARWFSTALNSNGKNYCQSSLGRACSSRATAGE